MPADTFSHPRDVAAKYPNRTALMMADSGQQLTYRQLVQRSDQCAQLLRHLGCAEGDTIAVLAENCTSFIEVCWAAKNSGLHYACISTHLTTNEAAYIAANSGARVLLFSQGLAEQARELQQELPAGTVMLVMNGPLDDFESYELRRDQMKAEPLANCVRGASMLYSSGTTGRPKGVRATLTKIPPEVPPPRHKVLVDLCSLDDQTVLIGPGPFYHAAPLRVMMATQRAGGTVIGYKKFDAEVVLRAIETHKVTHGFFVPTMLGRILRLSEEIRRSVDISSLRCALHSAAPCPVSVKEKLIDWWGPIICELYGGTESVGHFVITSEEWLRKKGSVGKAAKGCIVKILDDEGRELPLNEPGLIYMGNGREFNYHGDDAKTKEARNEDGLVTMGDVGYLDADGYLFLTDRQSNMIISGGVNIYPQEAENVLAAHEKIADVAVIGVPNEDFGEEVKAIIVPVSTDYDPIDLEQDILSFCRARLSGMKCPRSVEFIDEMPRNEAGKLLKTVIRAPYWEELESSLINT